MRVVTRGGVWAGVRESLPLVGSRVAGLPGKGLALP